jgi:hypothetical protein
MTDMNRQYIRIHVPVFDLVVRLGTCRDVQAVPNDRLQLLDWEWGHIHTDRSRRKLYICLVLGVPPQECPILRGVPDILEYYCLADDDVALAKKDKGTRG